MLPAFMRCSCHPRQMANCDWLKAWLESGANISSSDPSSWSRPLKHDPSAFAPSSCPANGIANEASRGSSGGGLVVGGGEVRFPLSPGLTRIALTFSTWPRDTVIGLLSPTPSAVGPITERVWQFARQRSLKGTEGYSFSCSSSSLLSSWDGGGMD